MTTLYLLYRRQLKLEGKPPAEKKPRKIKQYSDKRAKLNRQYSKESRPFWKEKMCEIRSPVCSGRPECINHKKGKATSELLMDKTYWQASCFRCNNHIEQYHKWGIENGHKVSRNTK